MTTAKFWIEAGTSAIVMDVRGHAGFDELGKDPVCAGASVTALTVAQCIDIMAQDGKLQKKPNVTIRNGRVTVVAKPQPEYFHEALHVFWMGQIGMRLLAENYPESVTLIPFEAALGADSINQKESST